MAATRAEFGDLLAGHRIGSGEGPIARSCRVLTLRFCSLGSLSPDTVSQQASLPLTLQRTRPKARDGHHSSLSLGSKKLEKVHHHHMSKN